MTTTRHDALYIDNDACLLSKTGLYFFPFPRHFEFYPINFFKVFHVHTQHTTSPACTFLNLRRQFFVVIFMLEMDTHTHTHTHTFFRYYFEYIYHFNEILDFSFLKQTKTSRDETPLASRFCFPIYHILPSWQQLFVMLSVHRTIFAGCRRAAAPPPRGRFYYKFRTTNFALQISHFKFRTSNFALISNGLSQIVKLCFRCLQSCEAVDGWTDGVAFSLGCCSFFADGLLLLERRQN